MVDQHLQRINLEYESKRQSFRLHDPETHILLRDAYARFKAACLEDGFRDGQFKFNLLMQDEKRRNKFNIIQRIENAIDQLGQDIINHANTMDDRRRKRLDRRHQQRKIRQERRIARTIKTN